MVRFGKIVGLALAALATQKIGFVLLQGEPAWQDRFPVFYASCRVSYCTHVVTAEVKLSKLKIKYACHPADCLLIVWRASFVDPTAE